MTQPPAVKVRAKHGQGTRAGFHNKTKRKTANARGQNLVLKPWSERQQEIAMAKTRKQHAIGWTDDWKARFWIGT